MARSISSYGSRPAATSTALLQALAVTVAAPLSMRTASGPPGVLHVGHSKQCVRTGVPQPSARHRL